jgi:PIN domain
VAPVYVLDSCVLYPVVTRDLLLTLATLDAFEPRWTEAILDEMTRNVLAHHPTIDPAHFEAGSVGAMRQAFPAASVNGYEHLIDRMDNHPKDRHVAAAAVHIDADALVTYNVRDFDSELLRKRAIAIVTPPQLVGQLVDDEPSVVALAVSSMAARKKRPPMSPADVVAAIVRQQGFGALEDSLHVLVD